MELARKICALTLILASSSALAPLASAQTTTGYGGTAPVFPSSVLNQWQQQPVTVNNGNGTTSTTTYNPVTVGAQPSYQSQYGQAALGNSGTATGYPYSSVLGNNRTPQTPDAATQPNAAMTGAPAVTPAPEVPGSATAGRTRDGAAPRVAAPDTLKPATPAAAPAAVSPYAVRPGTRVEGKAIAVSGDTVSLNGTLFSLHGVTAPDPKAVCSLGGNNWKCGVASLAALTGFVERGPIVCIAQAEIGPHAVAICKLGRDDLSFAMQETGLVTPTDLALIPPLRDAQADVRGLWSRKNP